MKIKRFFGSDMRDLLRQVKEQLGGDAVIMSNKKVAGGIEIVAAYDKEPQPIKPAKPKVKTAEPFKVSQPTPTLSEIIGDSGPDSLRALLDQQAEKAQQQPQSTNSTKPQSQPRSKAYAQQSSPAPESKVEQSELSDIKQELTSLRKVLEFQVSGLIQQDKQRKHPLHSYLTDKLQNMGIQAELADEVVSYAPADSNERDAWLFILKLLANRIPTLDRDMLSKRNNVIALVGPTGAGKTTTIAKLAARYAQKYGAQQVGLVTIDSYRIAAFEQLATYAKIIGCSAKRAHDSNELNDVLHQMRNKKLILIDTAGFSQRDSRLINQLDTLNQNSCANIKTMLVMQATAQQQNMQQTVSAYARCALHGCIVTKLDECYSLGEAVGTLISHELPLAWITDGQRVPEDIKVADAKYLVSMAAKLYKKYSVNHTEAMSTVSSAMAS